MKSFIELCLDGAASLSEIGDYIEKWHSNNNIQCDLKTYIGLTEYEYEKWLQKGDDILKDILYCRQHLVNYEDY